MDYIAEANLDYELELKRNPISPHLWLNYISSSTRCSHAFQSWLYIRAASALPRYYKLWVSFIRSEVNEFELSNRLPTDARCAFICDMFERALSNLSKMPRLWIMYIEFLIGNRFISATRRVINRALQALPITQHDRIWDVVINKYIGSEEFQVPVKTCKLLLRRYMQFEPGYVDAVISFLIDREDIASAVELLIKRMEESESESSARLILLIELISKNSNKLKSLNRIDLPQIIRAGIARYPDRLGELWNALSDYYIRLGLFSKAIEVYEEGLESIQTVVDFSVIFESYQNFLDLLVQSKLERGNDDVEFDLRRLELLIDRRPEMLSSVLLRQNPHNVIEWIKRTRLGRIAAHPQSLVKTFLDAINTVDPHSPSLVGRVSAIWIEFAKHYFLADDVDTARKVLEKAVVSDFRDPDDLAAVWIEWILMELRLALQSSSWTNVLEIARRSVSQYRGAPKGTVQANLFRVVKLWNLVLDVEDSINGETKPELIRGLFDAMFELKVVTPQSVLNYAQFETEKLCFEKAVQILEKGIALFPWPHCKDLWLMYLQLANQRRFSTERMRDLFEQVLSKCEVKFLPVFFYSYYLFELDRGLASDAIAMLNRASSAVQLGDKATFYVLAAKQAMDIQGLVGARRVLQAAVDTLTELSKKSGNADRLVMDICVEYSRIETEAGQIERARKLLEHAAQFANPSKKELAFIWELWKNFEVQHGTEETYKELKRVRRYVDVMYSDKHFNVMEAGVEPTVTETATSLEAPAQPAPGIDISKLRQMAQLRKQDDADFVPSESFQGSKPGFVFKNGEQGPGYYRDK